MSHTNLQSDCPGCSLVFAKYPGFNSMLADWFDGIRATHSDAHVSCAGRGRIDQEAAFARGASKAHYGQSSHNYNAAIDLWQMLNGVYTLDQQWFNDLIGMHLTDELKWYGVPGSAFFELPHVEVADWRNMAKTGTLTLVE